MSHTVHVGVSSVTPLSPPGVLSHGVHRAVPSTPHVPLHHHVGSVADYISYSYVNLNEIKQPIIRFKDTLQIRLAGCSEAIHPTRTPSVEQLVLLNGCPFTVHKKRSRIFHCQTDDSCCDYTLFLFKLKHCNQLKQQGSSCKASRGWCCRADAAWSREALHWGGDTGWSQGLAERGQCPSCECPPCPQPHRNPCAPSIGVVQDPTALSTAPGLSQNHQTVWEEIIPNFLL